MLKLHFFDLFLRSIEHWAESPLQWVYPPKAGPTAIFVGDAPYVGMGVSWHVKNLFFPSLDVSFGKFQIL